MIIECGNTSTFSRVSLGLVHTIIDIIPSKTSNNRFINRFIFVTGLIEDIREFVIAIGSGSQTVFMMNKNTTIYHHYHFFKNGVLVDVYELVFFFI